MNVPAGQALLLHIVPLAVWVLTHPTEKRLELSISHSACLGFDLANWETEPETITNLLGTLGRP